MKGRQGKLEFGCQHVRFNGKTSQLPKKKELDAGFGLTAAISWNNVGSSVCMMCVALIHTSKVKSNLD